MISSRPSLSRVRVCQSCLNDHDLMNADAHLYLFRRVFHNYYDDVCVGMVKNIASAMGPKSRLLIGDFVIPDKTEVGVEPNVYVMDLCMLMLSGEERKASQFREMLDKGGLEMVKIWKHEGTSQAIVEAKLKAA